MKWLFTLFFICLSVTLTADVIYLKDESVLHGKILNNLPDHVELSTTFAGVLKLSKLEINKIKIEEDNEALKEALAQDTKYFNENMIIWNKEKSITGKTRVVVPEKKKGPEWKYRLGVDFTGHSGNSDSRVHSGSAGAKFEDKDLRINIFAAYDLENKDSRETRNKTRAGFDYEDRLGMHSWYSDTDYERDRIALLEYRGTTALGYGYYFSKKAKLETRVRTGGFVRLQRYEKQEVDTTSGLDLGFYNKYQFENLWKLETDVSYKPSAEDFGDYNATHESSLEIPLDRDLLWNLKIGIRHEYTGRPQSDKENLDTKYYLRLSMGWF